MYQGHPFRSGVRTIFESSPPKSLRKPVVGVEISIDRENFREKAKPSEIEALLESIADPAAVHLVQIDPNSKLTRVPSAVARFVNLEYAHVSGSKLTDYSALFELRKIKSLFVIGHKAPQLWPMPELRLESFRSIRDRLEACSLSADRLWLQSSKLRRFDGGSVRRLEIENCNSLDLDSIGNLQGLAELQLMSKQKLPSLDFLGRSPSLRELSIYASLKDTNVDELKRSTTLTRVVIQLSAKRIAEVGVANPLLAITNGVDCFMGGKPARHNGDFWP